MSSLRFHFRRALRPIARILFVFVLAFAHSNFLNAQQSGVAIVFLAQPQISEQFWPVLFQSLREDLEAGTGELPDDLVLDRKPRLLRREDLVRGVQAASVIEVKLLGRCDVLPQADRPWRRASADPLGWVQRASGEIQPFIFIDCERLAQVLRQATLGLNQEERRQAMIHAIAHVLIHEWIHIVTQSSSHSAHGITRASLSVRELIASPQQERLRAANNLTSTNRP
jgi:hypothetical protein